MDRLTEKSANGDIGILCENCPEYKSCNEGNGCICVLTERLAAYEDTGLTAEQVKALQSDWVALKAAQLDRQWISVKDRLPENEEDDVLIYCREIEHYGKHKEKCKAYHNTYKGAYDGDRWYTNWCYGCKYIEDVNVEWPDEEITVTHWMPLPELPKEAQK